MKTRHPYGRDMASLLGNAAALHTIYILLNRDLADPADTLGILLWWGILLAAYAASALLLHVLHRQQWAAFVVLAALLGQIFAARTFGGAPTGLLAWLYLLLMWGAPLVRGCELLLHPAATEKRMLDFETTVLTLVMVVLMWAAGIFPASAVAPPAIGSALTLFSLAGQHTAGAKGKGRAALPGRIYLLLLPMAAGGACFLFLKGLAAPAARGVQWGTMQLLALLRGAAALISRFLTWIFSLFPTPEQGFFELPAPEEKIAVAADAGTVDGSLLMIPLLLLILAVGGFVLFTLLRRSITLPRMANRTGQRTRLANPCQRLRERLRRLLRRLRFHLTYLTHRNTPSGLLVWLEKTLRTRKSGRNPGETSRHFLLRAAGLLPTCREELEFLADCLDRQYFAGQKTAISSKRIRRIREKLSQELRQL